MAINWQINDIVDLSEPVSTRDRMTHVLMVPGNNNAHTWNIEVFSNGEPADLNGGTVIGHFIRPDNVDVVCAGSAAGNVASVVFNQYCYAAPGVCKVRVNIADAEENNITVAEAYMLVKDAMPDQVIDGGEIIPNLDELIAMVGEIDDAIDNANTAAQRAEDAAGDVTEANNYAKQSQSWAVGGTGIRPGEDTDNAKHYAEVAQQGAEEAGYAWFDIDDETGEMMVTVSDNLADDVTFAINENTGELEVTVNG